MEIKEKIISNSTSKNNIYYTGKTLALTFPAKDIIQEWECVSNLVNRIARYNTFDLNELIYNKTSFVINELMENAIKFSKDENSTISVKTLKSKDKIYVKITNQVSNKKWSLIKKIDSELKIKNLTKLLNQRITNLKTNLNGPGVGLILLKKDYTKDVQFLFYKIGDTHLFVSVIAVITIN